MLVSSVVVEHDVDRFVGRHRALDGIEKADEFLMPVALHPAPDDLAFKDVEGGEQGGGAPAFAGAGCCACNRVSSWHSAPSSSAARAGCAIERLDLAFLVDAEDHRMGRRIDVEANDILELVGEFGIVRNLERAHPMRLKSV